MQFQKKQGFSAVVHTSSMERVCQQKNVGVPKSVECSNVAERSGNKVINNRPRVLKYFFNWQKEGKKSLEVHVGQQEESAAADHLQYSQQDDILASHNALL